MSEDVSPLPPAEHSAGRDPYIDRRREHIGRFWRRVGGQPDYSGKRILEVGCGYGELAVHMAQHGAAEVIGVDVNPEVIQVGRELLAELDPPTASRIKLLCEDCRSLPANDSFDIIVSRDTFEHVQDLEGVVADLARRLRPGGRFYVGFGPLYRSPYGGHWRMRMPIPWGHLLLPEPLLVAWANRFRAPAERVTSIEAMGLNKRPLVDYERVFLGSGLQVVQWRVNHGERLLSRLFALLARFRPWRELFSHDVYAVLARDSGSDGR